MEENCFTMLCWFLPLLYNRIQCYFKPLTSENWTLDLPNTDLPGSSISFLESLFFHRLRLLSRPFIRKSCCLCLKVWEIYHFSPPPRSHTAPSRHHLWPWLTKDFLVALLPFRPAPQRCWLFTKHPEWFDLTNTTSLLCSKPSSISLTRPHRCGSLPPPDWPQSYSSEWGTLPHQRCSWHALFLEGWFLSGLTLTLFKSLLKGLSKSSRQPNTPGPSCLLHMYITF